MGSADRDSACGRATGGGAPRRDPLRGALVLLALLLASAGAAAQGLLFDVQPPTGGPPSFLLGTIHTADPRLATLPPPVQQAFDVSQGVALEVVPDAAAIIKAMVTMTYTDGRVLSDVLPPTLYRETAAALNALGMPEAAFKDFKPWAVVTLLTAPPAQSEDFLDMRLYRGALAAGKRVAGLESMEEQLGLFDALPEQRQIDLLRETLASREQFPELFEALIEAYLARDLDRLESLSHAYLDAGEPALAALFRSRLIDARNHLMLERMAPLLAEGGWLVAVGALHLPGDSGLLALLRGQGYRVSARY